MAHSQETMESLNQEIEKLRSRVEFLEKREQKCRQWFEDAPISLWEQDYSEVKRRVDEIKSMAVGDLDAYFQDHPGLVRELAGLVRVVDVNTATLRLYRVKTKKQFLSGITSLFSEESYEGFIRNLLTVAEGRTRFFTERTHVTLDGERLDVELHWSVAPGYEETYGRVLVSVVDISQRNRIERDLERRSRERRLLLDTIPVQVWYLSDVDTYGAVNRAHADFLGLHPRDMAYKRLENFRTPEVARVCKAGNSRVFETRKPVHTEEWACNAAGEKRLIAVTKTPRLNEKGEVEFIVCAGVDITDQRRTEMLLRESEARFRHIFEFSPVGTGVYDREGRLILANPACLEIFGIEDSREIVNLQLFDSPNLDESLKQRLRRGEVVQYDTAYDFEKVRASGFYRTHKGGIIHLHVVITPMTPNGENKNAGYLALVMDVTDRIMKEQQIRESEKLYRLITDNMADTVWVMDMNLRFTYVSPSVTRMYGTTVEEVMGLTIDRSVTPESMQKALAVFAEELALEAGGTADPERTRVMELEEYRKDGSTIWVESSLSFLRDEDQKPIGIIGASRDVTDRRRAEEERESIEAQNRQLQKADSLGRMAGAIAHHFNNQLQTIMGNLELAIADLSHQTGPVAKLMEAMKAADMAARISGQMLTYLGHTVGEQKTVDLSEICRLATPMLEAALPKDVDMENDFPSPGPVIQGNPSEIQQVLANLVGNASEAMSDRGGTIRVCLKTVSASDIHSTYRFPIDWQPKDITYACLEVRDTGPGIAQHDVERLFDPFYTTRFTGRGLGLSVAMGIVRAYGGVITVESRIGTRKGENGGPDSGVGGRGADDGGQTTETLGVLVYPVAPEDGTGDPVGSVFRVFLPLAAKAEDRVSQTEAKSPDLEGGGGTVLVVEDTAQVRELGVRMLQRLGFRVLEAEDGVEGIEVLREHWNEIGFVICDLTMPRMDGWETIASMRKIKPDIPVILASGYDEASVMNGDHPEVPQVFLAKPYGLEDLAKAIGKVDKMWRMPNHSTVRSPRSKFE